MYQELKLEKGMYHITAKQFSDVLESMDPSGQYTETALEGLDAYERQLKRFDIRVSGVRCDRVEKFFSTTESAVLFPEFIRRAIRSGVEQSVLSEIVAVHSQSDSSGYLANTLTDTTSYTTKTTQGNSLPTANYLEASTMIPLEKYGRTIHASYEAIRRQRLDSFATVLRSIGVRLANAILLKGIGVMEANAGSLLTLSGSAMTYADLTNLYGAFSDFDMTTLLASPDTAAKVMALDQMKEMASTQPSTITLPFGAQLRKCAGMSSNYVIGLDHNFGLEMVTCAELLLETDKLIESQLDVISVSMRAGFRVLTAAAVHVLNF